MALDHSDLAALARGLAPVLHEHTAAALAPLVKRLGELERRLAEAEKGGLRYRGVWAEKMRARVGDCTTYQGSLWICERGTTKRPGDGDSGWKLAVKRGRDGKDAR